MDKFLPFMTNDFSVGLYNDSVDDIYHSAFGALTEAFEKFVNPIDIKSLLSGKDTLNVLDICYGIGYNTKAFLQSIIEKKYKLNEINIDCVDIDNTLVELSPFINSKINFFQRIKNKKNLYKNVLNYNSAKKIVSLKKTKQSFYKINDVIDMIILKNLIKDSNYDFLSGATKKILMNKDFSPYFNQKVLDIYNFYTKNRIYLYKKSFLSTFVHNIYYRNITSRYKNLINNIININFYIEDIRTYIKNTPIMYDIVFLDGFTPSKCPCIWSLDFFEKLYSIMSPNAILTTYNTSSSARNAMVIAGFYIGNTFDSNGNVIGTIASKNNLYIKNPLQKKQLGLLSTKAGIPYRDIGLDNSNEDIILTRENEVKNSGLISSSRYMKEYKD